MCLATNTRVAKHQFAEWSKSLGLAVGELHPAQGIVELGVHIKGNVSIGTERRTGWKRRGHGEGNLGSPVEAVPFKDEPHPFGNIQSQRDVPAIRPRDMSGVE